MDRIHITDAQHRYCLSGDIIDDSLLLPCYYNDKNDTQSYGVMVPYLNDISNKYVRIPPNSTVTNSNGLQYTGSYLWNSTNHGVMTDNEIMIIPSSSYYVINGPQREYVNYCSISNDEKDKISCGRIWGNNLYYIELYDWTIFLMIFMIIYVVVALLLILLLLIISKKK